MKLVKGGKGLTSISLVVDYTSISRVIHQETLRSKCYNVRTLLKLPYDFVLYDRSNLALQKTKLYPKYKTDIELANYISIAMITKKPKGIF